MPIYRQGDMPYHLLSGWWPWHELKSKDSVCNAVHVRVSQSCKVPKQLRPLTREAFTRSSPPRPQSFQTIPAWAVKMHEFIEAWGKIMVVLKCCFQLLYIFALGQKGAIIASELECISDYLDTFDPICWLDLPSCVLYVLRQVATHWASFFF